MVDGLLHLVKTNTKAVEKIETYCRKIETLFASCQEKGNTFRIVTKKMKLFRIFSRKNKNKKLNLVQKFKNIFANSLIKLNLFLLP